MKDILYQLLNEKMCKPKINTVPGNCLNAYRDKHGIRCITNNSFMPIAWQVDTKRCSLNE